MKDLMPKSDSDRFGGLDAYEVKRERLEVWEERLHELAHVAQIDLSQLDDQKSHPDKVRLAAALKLSSSVSNGWLAKRLQMG